MGGVAATTAIAVGQLSGVGALSASANALGIIYPLLKWRHVTDNFNAHVLRGSVNPGTDYDCPVGTDVLAVKAGTVTMSAFWGEAGNTVRVDHGGGVVTEYLHNSALLVSAGDQVAQGQVIAKSGNTGSASTGAHLHISLKLNGSNVDFEKYIGVPATPNHKGEQDVQYWKYQGNGMLAAVDNVRMEYRYLNQYEAMVVDNLVAAGLTQVSVFGEPA